MQDFDALRREATKLERYLEERVSRYQQLSQKMTTADTTSSSSTSTSSSSSSLLHSLENGTLLSNNSNNDEEEISLRNDIQRTLSTLSELIQSKLSPAAEVSGKSQHLLLVKRYREILFDLTSDFQKTSAQLQRKKQQAELFAGANRHNNSMGPEHDAATEHLLRERNHIGNSLAASSQIIAQATEIHSDLRTQGASLRGVTGTLVKIGSQVPGLNRLMENIRRKKGRDDMIVSAVIALCIVFTLWYLFG